MQSTILKYLLPAFFAIILLDLNEFISRYLGSQGVLTNLIFGMSVLLILISKPISGSDNRLNRRFLIAFFGFIGLGALASILDGNSKELLNDMRYYLPSFLIYFSIYRSIMGIRKKSDLYRIISIAVVLIGINAILILLSIVFNIDFHGSNVTAQVDRAVGLYSNANRAGYVSIIGQCLALLLLFSEKVKLRNLYFGIYVLCFLAAISTFSKGTILLNMLLLVRMLYSGLTERGEGQSLGFFKRYVRVFSFLLLFLASGFVLGFVNIQSRLSSLQSNRINQVQLLLQGEINDVTTTHRTELAKLALEEIQRTFFLGAGLGTFKKMDNGLGTHNTYLLILGESGVIALILYLAFFATWARKSFAGRNFDSIRFTSGNILLLFFFSSFVAHTNLSNKPFILTLALIFAALKVGQQRRFKNN